MKVKEISGRNNPVFKEFTELLKGRGVKKSGMTLLSGPKQTSEVLKEFPEQCAGVLLPENQDIPVNKLPAGTTIFRFSLDLFRDIDIYGTDQPILLVRADPIRWWDNKKWPSGCTLFVPFQDPANVGAVIRSAAGFGVSRVIILREAANPFNHKAIRVAGNALFRIPIFKGPSIHELDKITFPVITLSPKGINICGYGFPLTFGLLPGLEGPGLPENLKDSISLAIPMENCVKSFNSALATGIALYEWQCGFTGSQGRIKQSQL